MILILEDSATQASELAEKLQRRFPGQDFEVAHSLREFTNAYHRKEPALIVADILLPDIEPEALILSLKLVASPVLFFSSSDYGAMCRLHEQKFFGKADGFGPLLDEVSHVLEGVADGQTQNR